MNHLRITYESPKNRLRITYRLQQERRHKPHNPLKGEEEGRGNADWQSAQYKESNGGKNATEGN